MLLAATVLSYFLLFV